MRTTGLTVGEYEIFWLNGGSFKLDGGAMFGPVPKSIWSTRYPVEQNNNILLTASPMLIKGPDSLILVESGIGNKLTAKQRQIFQIQREWDVIGDLKKLGISRHDIDTVVLTHGDWDHAGGIVMTGASGEPELSFPRARHLLQRAEWEDICQPCTRSSAAYWPINTDALNLSSQLVLVEEMATVAPGITVRRTGGHTRGHQVVFIESQGEQAIHLGDLFPTRAHLNPLWVMAYDNFPLEVIERKKKLIHQGMRDQAWFLFYHDPFCEACKFGTDGKPSASWSARTDGA